MMESGDARLQAAGLLYGLFNARAYWGAGSIESLDEPELRLIVLLYKLQSTGELKIEFSTIPYRSLRDAGPPANQYEKEMQGLARGRKCTRALNDHMWSGYSWLQTQLPDTPLATFNEEPPYLYVAPESRVAITAGTLPIEATLGAVVRCHLADLYIVAANGVWNDRVRKGTGSAGFLRQFEEVNPVECDMARLSFTNGALEMLSRVEASELARLQAALDRTAEEGEDPLESLLNSVIQKSDFSDGKEDGN